MPSATVKVRSVISSMKIINKRKGTICEPSVVMNKNTAQICAVFLFKGFVSSERLLKIELENCTVTISGIQLGIVELNPLWKERFPYSSKNFCMAASCFAESAPA